jgi:LmbE family N-acetylglucosaminyl deacetylase
MKQVAVSVLAHPDDAEILCAGTLARLAELDWEVHICTMTPGDVGSTTLDRWEISAIRTAEARAAAAVIGATYHCLDQDDVFIMYNRETLKKVLDLYRTISPTLVITHAPRDYMIDHDITSQLARSASFGYSAPNASTTALAPNSHIPHLYYCDPIECLDPFGKVVGATTLIDISQHIEIKTRMLSCHASQREWLRSHQGMDEYLDTMRRIASERGKLAGTEYAEGFQQHLGSGHPNNDVLAELLS